MTGLRLCLIGIFLLFALTVTAAERKWKQIGPPGGDVFELIPDRSRPNVWFASAQAGLYRSDNNAKSWKLIQPEVYRFTLRNADRSQYYISRYPEYDLWKSVDDGQTFLRVGKPFLTYGDIFLDHFGSRLLYQRGDSSVYVSQDDGNNWQEMPIHFDPPSNLNGCSAEKFEFTDFTPSPFTAGGLFATVALDCPRRQNRQTYLTLFLESKDQGRNWAVVYSRHSPPYRFQFDPAHPGKLFAFNVRYIEEFSGSKWERFAEILCDAKACSSVSLRSVPNHPSQFFLTQQITKFSDYKSRLLFTSNSGKTWKEQENPFDSFTPNIFTMQQPDGSLLAGTNGLGIFLRSTDQKWRAASNGIQTKISFQYLTVSGTTIYAYGGIGGSSLLARSDDGGKSWLDIFPNQPHGRILAATADPRDPKRIFLEVFTQNSGSKFYRSMDGGYHWNHLFSLSNKGYSTNKVVFDPIRPATIYFLTNRQVWKSTQSGNSPVRLNVIAGDMAVDRQSPDTVYFVYRGQVSRSDDGGMTTRQTHSIPIYDDGEASIYITQKGDIRGSFLLADDWENLLHTETGGAWWRHLAKVPAGIGGGADPPGARPVVSADSLGTHFFVPTKIGFFESTDGGIHWKNIRQEFPKLRGGISFLAASDPRAGVLVVTTYSSGMFRQK